MTILTQPSVLPSANDACWCGSGRKYKRCHKPLEGRVQPGEVSPRRNVPASITRPPYADTGEVIRWNEPAIKSPEIIARMRHAGAVAAEILRLAGAAVKPGMTTDEIDVYVHDLCIERNSYPSPLNYMGYPKSVCTSVNEVICHGIPDSRKLEEGDIVNLDVTCFIGGVHGDTNATFAVGKIDAQNRALIDATEECIWRGIEAVKPGRPLSDIGRAIEDQANLHKLGVVRAFVGHGIGEQFHTDIQVLHYYDSRNSVVMRPGMTFTIEPMIRDVGIDILRQLTPGKKTYIGQLEALAAAAVVHTLPPEWLAGRDGFMWIDNMGAKYSLQKGSARKEDSARIVDSFSKRVASLGFRPWIEYVPSAQNVADLPSRDKWSEYYSVIGADEHGFLPSGERASEWIEMNVPDVSGWSAISSPSSGGRSPRKRRRGK